MANLDLSSLNAYVNEKGNELIAGQIYPESTLIKMFDIQTGIVSDQLLPVINTTVVFHDGKGKCAPDNDSEAAFSQIPITMNSFHWSSAFCQADYDSYFLAESGMNTPGEEFLPLQNEILDPLIKGAGFDAARAVWFGNKGLTASDANLQLNDGLIVLAGATSSGVNWSQSATSSVFETVKTMIKELPANVFRQDAKIIMAPEQLTLYVMELIEKNMYNPASFQVVDGTQRGIAFGTNIEIIGANEFEGEKYVVITDLKNIKYCVDTQNNTEKFDINFNVSTRTFDVYSKFNFGVNFKRPYDVLIGEIL